MKMTLRERVEDRIWSAFFYKKHPNFVKRYNKRFSKDFSQEDLVYCVSLLYELRLRKKLNLNNPQTFNEKLNWLKCYYHDDRMTECVDKATAPAHFRKQTGLNETYIVKKLGIYDTPEEIIFESLPKRFVLKSNWGSGKQIIVKDKDSIDIKKIKEQIKPWIENEKNHYFTRFEYGYKNIVPKIVCEEFIDFDYKLEFFCFDGKPVYFWTIFGDKTDDVCADFYDAASLRKINMKHGYPNSGATITIPKEYNEMFDVASKLSKGFPFVRVDFFKTSDSFKFSEMTFYHWGGLVPFTPKRMDLEFGKNIKLPEKMI